MQIEKIIVGELETNCYFLVEKNKAIIIDPGAEPERIIEFTEKEQLIPQAIINTHGHYDHVSGNNYLQNKYNIPVYYPEEDKYLLPIQQQLFAVQKFIINKTYKDKIEFEKLSLKVLATPGHSKGSSCLLLDNILFSGDTIFAGGYLGRTDLWGGSMDDLQLSLKKILKLPIDTIIYPGHGPSTTLALERGYYE